MRTNKFFVQFRFLFLAASIGGLTASIVAQTAIPTPGKPRTVSIPAVKEVKLKNGLTVAVVERKSMPLVTVQLLVKRGSGAEPKEKAGLANLTASMLTKGTKTRSATQIAEDMEFLGSSIFSFAGWQNSSAGMTVTSDKFDAAMAIFSDIVRNPVFPQDELDLEKAQAVDGLTANLAQPGFLANYIASTYSFGEHPTGGTLSSISSITKADVSEFYAKNFRPEDSVLIFVGDISPEKAAAAAEKHFGNWQGLGVRSGDPSVPTVGSSTPGGKALINRVLVVDMPNSGQASVNFVKPISGIGRQGKQYYSASLLNSLLGGGYSSRLNQEIRIKRGLSYGAGSSFAWRPTHTNFGARAQTKDESAAEVAELMLAEIKRLGESVAPDVELSPRKSVLTGGFGRNLETNQGIAGALTDLYAFGIPTAELNAYMNNVNSVQSADVRSFASSNLVEGDLIIVGDYAKFKDDLAKRFPNVKVEVIKASEFQSDSAQ
jgi:zinc protease